MEEFACKKETIGLTNRGPISNLWATGARMNHIIIAAQVLVLREKIAIKSISTTATRLIRMSPLYFCKLMVKLRLTG